MRALVAKRTLDDRLKVCASRILVQENGVWLEEGMPIKPEERED